MVHQGYRERVWKGMGSNWWRWQVGLAVVCALHYIGATEVI